MQRQQAAIVWAKALRFVGLLRAFLARFFPSPPSALVYPTVNSLAASQERIEFVISVDRLPPAPSFPNGQLDQSPAACCDDELPCRGEQTGGETGAGAGERDEAGAQAEEGIDRGSLPLASTLEGLLFITDEPVDAAHLAQAVRASQDEVRAALAQLRSDYETHDRGVRLQERRGRYQLVTNPAAAQAVEDFLNLDLTTRLSGPALETLAIIAYRQPVTRAQIEAVRGVDCSGMVRKLEQRGLVEEMGRLETPGRPILYGVTDLFLQHFGLTHLEELPALPELDADSLQAVMALAEEPSV